MLRGVFVARAVPYLEGEEQLSVFTRLNLDEEKIKRFLGSYGWTRIYKK
jgi:hypothetical protein